MCSLSCRNFAPALGLVPWVSEISGTQGWIGLWVPALGLTPSAGMTMRRWSLRFDQSEFALEGCAENSEGACELAMIAETLGAYERKRWPDGKVPGGKG